MLFEGIFAPLTTCFHGDGSLYWHKLEQNVEHYSRAPLSGLVLLGSTGEAVMLSDEESKDVLRVAVGAARPEKVLVAGVGRESVIETLRLAEYAAQLAYDAVLVRTPHYYRPSMGTRELRTYYQTIADRSPLPVLLYNIPAYTAYDLPVAVVAELAMHPNIAGIKESSGSVERIRQIVASTQAVKKSPVTVTNVFAAVTARMPGTVTRTKEIGFQVLNGSAQILHSSLEAGATAGVLAVAAFAPQACHEIYTAWKEGDRALAAEKQQRVFRAGEEVAGSLGVPGVKYALDLNGYFGGAPRLPLLPLTAGERTTVEDALQNLRN